jgi:hypothetical protein
MKSSEEFYEKLFVMLLDTAAAENTFYGFLLL